MALTKEISYARKTALQKIQKLRAILSELPMACADFLNGIAETSSTQTRLAYAYDLRIFFHFVIESVPRVPYAPHGGCIGRSYSADHHTRP